jgi:hypothetical protein
LLGCRIGIPAGVEYFYPGGEFSRIGQTTTRATCRAFQNSGGCGIAAIDGVALAANEYAVRFAIGTARVVG